MGPLACGQFYNRFIDAAGSNVEAHCRPKQVGVTVMGME